MNIQQLQNQYYAMLKYFGGKGYDTANISGAKLAEIGKAALMGELVPKKVVARSDVIDYESLKWLDDRIREVCNRGKI